MRIRDLVFGLGLALAAGGALADSFVFGGTQDRPPARLIVDAVSIDHADRGNYRSDGAHTPSNLNYIAGTCFTGCQNVPFDVFRNFFVFDISNLSAPVSAATLSLNTGFVVGNNHYDLYDVTGDLGVLRAGVGGLASFADLGSGDVYGARDYTPADTNLRLLIELNAAGVADLNAAIDARHAFFAIGGAATAVLAPIPEPSILATMALGLAGLGWTSRRRLAAARIRKDVSPVPEPA